MASESRSFDHAEAQGLRDSGLSWEAIGEALGVNPTTVRRRLDPRAAKVMAEYNRSRRRQQEVPTANVKRGHQFPWEGSE